MRLYFLDKCFSVFLYCLYLSTVMLGSGEESFISVMRRSRFVFEVLCGIIGLRVSTISRVK